MDALQKLRITYFTPYVVLKFQLWIDVCVEVGS